VRTLEIRCFAGAALAGGLSGACAVVGLCAGGGGTIAKSIRPRTIIPSIAMITMFQRRKLTTLFTRSFMLNGNKIPNLRFRLPRGMLAIVHGPLLAGAASNAQSGTLSNLVYETYRPTMGLHADSTQRIDV
jgi:hypothetical protein